MGLLHRGGGADDHEVGELSRLGEETDPRTRATMLDEGLDEGLDPLASLRSGAQVQHEGEPFTARDVELLPAATRPRGHPVLVLAQVGPYAM